MPIPTILRSFSPISGASLSSSLRTLEFWVDNLNPDFLYPILAQDTSVFTDLMASLSMHLKPAPYPYGLLTLRLLGKLGGKNRQFLREPMALNLNQPDGYDVPELSIECAWSLSSDVDHMEAEQQAATKEIQLPEGVDDREKPNEGPNVTGSNVKEEGKFALPLPLDRAVEVLQIVSSSSLGNTGKCTSTKEGNLDIRGEYLETVNWREPQKLLMARIEEVDLKSYCKGVMEETMSCQADAALTILTGALAAVLEVKEDILHKGVNVKPTRRTQTPTEDKTTDESGLFPPGSTVSEQARCCAFRKICQGLFYATVVDGLKEKAYTLLMGLSTHMFLIAESHDDLIVPIDASGNRLAVASGQDAVNRAANVVNGRLQPLRPIGFFRLEDPLRHGGIGPFIFNEAIIDILCETGDDGVHRVVMDVVQHLVKLSVRLSKLKQKKSGECNDAAVCSSGILQCGSKFFESLLSLLCRACLSKEWNIRTGVYEVFCSLLSSLGQFWARRYEVEIFHAALFSIRDSPKEVSFAAQQSLSFFVRVCWLLYGGGNIEDQPKPVLHDVLSISNDLQLPSTPKEHAESRTTAPKSLPQEAVLHMLINEISSTKHLIR